MSTMQISLFDFAPIESPAAVARVIRRCKRANCKHTWARDYDALQRTRMNESGSLVSSSHPAEWRCPSCGSASVDGSTVQGRQSQHVCDARCMCATGHDCECSCGGKNHGKAWLI